MVIVRIPQEERKNLLPWLDLFRWQKPTLRHRVPLFSIRLHGRALPHSAEGYVRDITDVAPLMPFLSPSLYGYLGFGTVDLGLCCLTEQIFIFIWEAWDWLSQHVKLTGLDSRCLNQCEFTVIHTNSVQDPLSIQPHRRSGTVKSKWGFNDTGNKMSPIITNCSVLTVLAQLTQTATYLWQHTACCKQKQHLAWHCLDSACSNFQQMHCLHIIPFSRTGGNGSRQDWGLTFNDHIVPK